MGALLSAVAVLLMAYTGYRNAKRQGVWHPGLFWGILAGMAAFIAFVLRPLVRSHLIDTNPNLLGALVAGGALVFAAVVVLLARHVSKGWKVDGQN